MKKLLLLLIFVFPLVSHSAANLGNGESCLRDGECVSGECKRFQCEVRVKPKGDLGDRCIFDGDCKSDECKKYRCEVNER